MNYKWKRDQKEDGMYLMARRGTRRANMEVQNIENPMVLKALEGMALAAVEAVALADDLALVAME